MNTLRCEFNISMLDRDPRNGFKTSKLSIIENGGLRTDFTLLCQRLHPHMKSFTAAVKNIYDLFLTKTIHARFSVVFRQWKEANVKIHGQVGFRPKLKALTRIKTTAKKSMKSVAKSSEKEPMPKLTTQVCADNRKKRREVLDR